MELEIHPERQALNNEVHARPSVAVDPPLRLSYIVMFADWPICEKDREPIRALARHFGKSVPENLHNHYTEDLGPFTVTWERHTEFYRFLFTDNKDVENPFADPVINKLPKDWLNALPGQLIVANHGLLLKADDEKPWVDGAEENEDAPPSSPIYEQVSQRYFEGQRPVGARVGGGAAVAMMDFRIHGDGFGRIYVHDYDLTPWQRGRLIQRLLELDTYRVMSLLALPVAREYTPELREHETELAQITNQMLQVKEEAEPLLLDQLMRLQAETENLNAGSDYRFSATAAYYAVVDQRLNDLRENRIQGMQTFREFMDRRLAPAVNTCRSVSARLDTLSRRVGRATQMLSTRVNVLTQSQNRDILNSMNRRAKIQLRQQQAIEALSLAAVTYYVIGLVSYGAKGLKSMGVKLDPDLVVGIAMPIVALAVWRGLHLIQELFADRRKAASEPESDLEKRLEQRHLKDEGRD